MKNNNSSGANGMHNPSSVTAIPLTREHYMVIGNPRGKISIQIQMVYQNSKCIQ